MAPQVTLMMVLSIQQVELLTAQQDLVVLMFSMIFLLTLPYLLNCIIMKELQEQQQTLDMVVVIV